MNQHETDIYNALMAHAAKRGRADGSWVIDGNTSDETIAAILRGYEDGDPAIYDQVQPSPLSGEHAGLSMPEIWHDATGEPEPDGGWPLYMADEYELAYSDAFWAEVISSARFQLGAES